MGDTGRTALVVMLPAADPLLDAARRIAPDRVRPGVGAHVTVLYPFVPVAEAADAVRELAAGYGPVGLDLTETVTAPGFAAVPVPALQPVVDAAAGRWPQTPPYGGRFGPRPAAHLTLAMGGTATELDRVTAGVRPLLPVRAAATALLVVELTDQGWRPRLDVPLGAR